MQSEAQKEKVDKQNGSKQCGSLSTVLLICKVSLMR